MNLNKTVLLRAGFAAGAIALLFLFSGVLAAAVTAGVSLLILIILAIVMIAIFQTIPFLLQKIENKVLSARKNEARQNPIEQLQNFLLGKKQRVAQFKTATASIGAQIRSLEDMVTERKRTKPGYDASRQESSITAMKSAHAVLVRKYKAAEDALVQLEEAVEDKKFEWKFAQAGQSAIRSLNATSGEELLDQMLADEAFSSVKDNFHQVFAELEMEAGRLDSAKQLSFGNGMILDISDIHLKETL